MADKLHTLGKVGRVLTAGFMLTEAACAEIKNGNKYTIGFTNNGAIPECVVDPQKAASGGNSNGPIAIGAEVTAETNPQEELAPTVVTPQGSFTRVVVNFSDLLNLRIPGKDPLPGTRACYVDTSAIKSPPDTSPSK